tara:strand:+ start:3181 stop:3708 length:528 start_codon:yes stop_codon:yes gene_type:complete
MVSGLDILETMIGKFKGKNDTTQSEEIIMDKYNISQGALDNFSEIVSGIESDYGQNLINPNSTAKGIYQFTDAGFETAVQRTINLYESAGKDIPTWLTDAKKKDVSVMDLTSDQQKDLFFANLAQHPAKTMDLLKRFDQGDNSAGFDLFAKYHHTKGYESPTKEHAASFFGIEVD